MLARLVMLIAIASGWSYALAADSAWSRQAAGSVAVIRGEIEAPGLHHAVRVQRDTWGVAHIYADDQHDLFFAQGFVAAQDRLFQMELWKRAGQGRLAELLGPSAVKRDMAARLLRYRGDMAAEYASYAPDTLEILQAFTAGINAHIAALRAPGGRGLSVEFRMAGFDPEPWKPEDCLNRLAAYSMMGNASSELLHAQLLELVGAAKATELLNLDPPVPLDPAPGTDFSGLSPALLANVVSSDVRTPFPATPSLRESNNWTVSGTLTATGRPLLAGDPHRVIAQPSLRYIVHLVAPGWNVIGAGEPALPGVALGHNEHIAWAFTIFGLDQEDLYLETLNPANPKQYRTAQGWSPMLERRELIRVRGGSDVTAILHFTGHGPVLWEDGKRALALRWVGAEPGTAGYLGSLSVDRAQNWREFELAMARWKVPSENIVYADREGNIGEHSTGLAPLRKNFNGLLPLPANGRYEWTGFVPNAELPRSFNPAEGFIASANQKMIPDGYPYAVGFEWAAPTRFERIHEALQTASHTGHKLTLADMEALQTDVVSLLARDLQLLLRKALALGSPEASKPVADAAGLLLQWDCAVRADSSAAALYEFWALELRKAVTHLAVPERARALVKTWPLSRVVAELSKPRPEVFGDAPATERDRVLLDSLRVAYGELSRREGPDPRRWSWGSVHKAYFRHALDAIGGPTLLDRGPVERPGDDDVVQATYFHEDSFDQVSGASYREIFDLSDWDNALAINVPGQSGQPDSPHFDDLLPLWSKGAYFPLKFSRQAVDAVTRDTLILRP
ncbi:MAG: penicillin acylase family protein [Steroidobacteraceae bacterium]